MTGAASGGSGERPGTGRFEWVPGAGRQDGEAVLELGSNENPLGPSPHAVAAVRRAAVGAHRYPRSPQAILVDRLASRWSVQPERIWIGPGSVGVIDYLHRALLEPGDRVLAPDPGFPYFGRSSVTHHGKCRSYPLPRSEDFAFQPRSILDRFDGESIIYVNTPHNPTGAVADLAAIETVARETPPSTIVVVDEAYGPFTETASAMALVHDRDDVAVLRTFSKAYGLAGCRVGYGVLPRPIANDHDRKRTPWAVSGLSCIAAAAALGDDEYLDRSVRVARIGRAYLPEALASPSWWSEGNFVLVEVDDASTVAEAALERGVRVRDCTGFGLPDCVRVTVGTADQNRRAVTVLNEVTR